jgi:LysM repeat protein
LTVVDNCDATGQDTAEVTISGPTPPPGTGTPNPTATATGTAEPPPDNITLGYCYIVNYGDTLSGIAWYYGIPLQDLAYVNNVPLDYFVKLGEGLFIPYGPITEGANGYQVQYGDTIHSIAYQCAVTPAAVAEANGIPVDAELTPGEVIIIPIGRY